MKKPIRYRLIKGAERYSIFADGRLGVIAVSLDLFEEWQRDMQRLVDQANLACEPSEVVQFADCDSAAAFTRQRLAQIAEVEEEIKVLRGYDADNSCHSACCMDRTLGRLESILADLKRGMK